MQLGFVYTAILSGDSTETNLPLEPVQHTHKLAVLVYLLLFLGMVFGVTAFIGMLINHTNFKSTENTYLRSHFIWQILAFWTLCAIGVAVVMTWQSTTSTVLLTIGVVWWLFNLLTGAFFLHRRKPIPLFN